MSFQMSLGPLWESMNRFYRQHPLPVYPDPPEPRVSQPKQAIPDDIKIWAASHSLSLDYTRIEVLPTTSPFPLSSPLPLSLNNLNDAQLSTVAQGLALHVLQADRFMWKIYEEIVDDKAHLFSLREKFFKIFANFALHIFDIEDFVRVVEKPMILNNVAEFCHDLEDKVGIDNLDELASGAISNISSGKMDIEKFPFLWQLDIDFILGCYKDNPGQWRYCMGHRMSYTYDNDIITGIEKFYLHKHYVTTALEAIREHKPLPQGKRMDLMLNGEKRRCVLRQALYLEAWRGFKEEDLTKLYLGEDDPNQEEEFITSFHEALSTLALMKAQLVSFSERVFCSPAETGRLRNFHREVAEAVRIANYERMRLGYRFLTTDHLLFGLSRSRVASKMRVFERTWVPTPEVREFPGTNLLYCILKVSCDAAACQGLDEVLLEHLYLATKFATRLLPADDNEQMIDWHSIFEQEAIADFLKENVVEPERQRPCEEMSEKALWRHFFQGDDCCMPFTPKAMLETLAREFRENKFNPLETCLSCSTQNLNIARDAIDPEDGMLRHGGEYCHLYSQYLVTLYDEADVN